MKFGLFYQIQVPKPWDEESEARRIWEALDQIAFAEEMGYDSVWFSEHHFRPVWSHNSAPDLTLAAVTQRTSRIRMGIGVVLAPIHHPLHTAARMATLDILSKGRVDVGLGRTGYPYQLTPYGTDLEHTRGMWEEFAEVLPRIWTEEEVSHDGEYFHIPPRQVLPKPLQKPHPPLWSACASEETTRRAGELGLGALVGSEGGMDRVAGTLELYYRSLNGAHGATVNSQNALMTAGFCHEDPKVAVERGTELVSWYLEQQRERARLVWRGVDPARFRPTIKATTSGICALPPGRTRATPPPMRWSSTAQTSASAPRTTASASWKTTRLWALSRFSVLAPSARPATRKP